MDIFLLSERICSTPPSLLATPRFRVSSVSRKRGRVWDAISSVERWFNATYQGFPFDFFKDVLTSVKISRNSAFAALVAEEVARRANGNRISKGDAEELRKICPQRKFQCAPGRFRTPAGGCNNVDHPEWGASLEPFLRVLPPNYDDGLSAARQKRLPDPFLVVNQLEKLSSPKSLPISRLFAEFLSLVFDDISRRAPYTNENLMGSSSCCSNSPECIHSTKDDMIPSCSSYSRSLAIPSKDCHPIEREQVNMVSGYLDASTIYGNSSLAEMHTKRTLCGRLQRINPSWTDERLFEESRKIIGALLQHLTYNEMLPLLLGREIASKISHFVDFSDEFISPHRSINSLKNLYHKIDYIDLLSGVFVEKSLNGAIVGPTLACILEKQFIKLKFSDRFWYDSSLAPTAFTSLQIAEIKKFTVANLLCLSEEVAFVQPSAFLLSDHFDNAPLHCNLSSTIIDLSFWKEDELHREVSLPSSSCRKVFDEAEKEIRQRDHRIAEKTFNLSPQISLYGRFTRPKSEAIAVSRVSRLLLQVH
ncbi:unnamed protein product, partial [Mesorhabditis belari]|uniref:Peroxidase n=1 Tax=Mesorhabditis belari TaxID=2138241 RepID=A0AAF3EQL2_9BILA